MIPLTVPTVSCLAVANGCAEMRIPLADAQAKTESQFCGGCAARGPCGKSRPVPANVQLRPIVWDVT